MRKSKDLGLNSGFDICKLYKRTRKLSSALPLTEPASSVNGTHDSTCPTVWGASTKREDAHEVRMGPHFSHLPSTSISQMRKLRPGETEGLGKRHKMKVPQGHNTSLGLCDPRVQGRAGVWGPTSRQEGSQDQLGPGSFSGSEGPSACPPENQRCPSESHQTAFSTGLTHSQHASLSGPLQALSWDQWSVLPWGPLLLSPPLWAPKPSVAAFCLCSYTCAGIQGPDDLTPTYSASLISTHSTQLMNSTSRPWSWFFLLESLSPSPFDAYANEAKLCLHNVSFKKDSHVSSTHQIEITLSPGSHRLCPSP